MDAVGDAIDEDVDGGVVFRSSRCVEHLADARVLAIEDAGTRIAGLGQCTPEAVVLLREQPGDGLGFDLSPCDPERLPTNEYGANPTLPSIRCGCESYHDL